MSKFGNCIECEYCHKRIREKMLSYHAYANKTCYNIRINEARKLIKDVLRDNTEQNISYHMTYDETMNLFNDWKNNLL
jgi:hypothetical protein